MATKKVKRKRKGKKRPPPKVKKGTTGAIKKDLDTLQTPPKRNTFLIEPMRELQRKAEEVLGSQFIVRHHENPEVVMVDTPESLLCGECKIVIEDPDCKELLWALLIEKKKLLKEETLRCRRKAKET